MQENFYMLANRKVKPGCDDQFLAVYEKLVYVLSQIRNITRILPLTLRACLAAGLVCLLASAHVSGGWQAPAVAQELTITPSFVGKDSIAPDEPIELTLNRPLTASEGRLAVLIGATDLTGLFTVEVLRMKFVPNALPLTPGETEMTVYLVSPNNEWKEVARFPLRVVAQAATQKGAHAGETATAPSASERRRLGFDKLEIVPSFNIGLKSQFAEIHAPEANKPARPRFTDATIQGSLKTEMARDRMTVQSQFDIVGSSFRNEALRFDAQGEDAPKVDLSSYLMQVQHGSRKLLAGHSTFGGHRHLINNFASRGLVFTYPVANRADFSLVGMNSTSIVGWDNFFGLANRRHQLFGGIFGVEVFKNRPGGLRFEGGLIDAWFQPRVNVNQNKINDTERSRGLSARVLAKDKSGRVRLDTGFTRSQFLNPEDPLLSQGASVVPSRQVTRSGRYADVSFDLFREFTLAKPRNANQSDSGAQVDQNIQDAQNAQAAIEPRKFNLTLNVRHERVDPLFKSLGANTQADLNQNQVEMVGAFGELTFTAAHTRLNDNLAGIPTILRTNTRRNSFAVNTPLQGLLTNRAFAQPNPFLPRIGYTFEHVRAFADFIPTGGGFDQPGAIPDQANIVQSLVAEWQFKDMRVAYRLNHSLQDNRAVGRERADLQNFIHNATFGWNPLPTLDFNFELSFEDANNREQARTDRTLRFGFIANWQATTRQSLNAVFSTIGAGDLARTNNSRNIEFDVQWNYRLARESENRFKKIQTVYFIRYSNRFVRSRNFSENINTLTKLQTFNTGLNFIFF